MQACNQCGKCCIKYADGGLSASQSEIDWWETNRPEIYRYVSNNRIWVSPETGRQLSYCPWLQRDDNDLFSCQIYHDRPEDCRHYPTHIDEMISDECEMLEPGDLPQSARAQQRLDIIMSDSRPPYQGR